MIETEYLVDAGGNQLAGTLTLPNSEGKFPTVIYLQGSGKMDRNDNFPSSKDKTPKSTRDFFNSLGFATLRYDKRGVADSEGDFYSASHQDLVDDAIHVLDFVLQNDSCDSDKIFLLGHSEGCFISCEVIAQRSCIAGTILLCPVYKSIEETLLSQAQSMKTLAENQSGIGGVIMRTYFRISDPVKSHRKFVEKIKNSKKDVTRFMMMKFPAGWYREILQLDPPSIYAQVHCPTLVIGGSKDMQCDPNDVELVGNAVQGEAETHVVVDMTHVLRKEPGDISFSTNARLLKQPVDDELLAIMKQWLCVKA